MTEIRSYYGQPVIKEPVWTWEIPCYFFAGGLAGASASLAYLCELSGDDVLARRVWGAAFAGIVVSPALLISDLGRPRRFLNMLRMFKVTSPMSVGSWILTVSSTTTAVAVAHSWLGVLPRLAAMARPAAALAGLPLSTYTGALVANTAIPVWHESRQMLPFVFASGAGLSAGAAGIIATPLSDAGAARRLALGSVAVEMAAKELMERRLGDQGEPYREGAAKRFGDLGRGCLVAGSAVLLWRGARSRRAAVAAGTLLLTGALSARWSVFKAGFTSVADPKYVVGPQRERVQAGTRPGAARSEPHAAAAPGP